MTILVALACGLVFGLGLLGSGMADPVKVLAFLDVAGAWDPSLLFVMGGAIAVGLGAFAIAKRRERSWSGAPMALPTATRIDTRLVVGGLLFGAGWGLAGYCPGPALVGAASGSDSAATFVVAMLAGVLLHDNVWSAWRARRAAAATA